MVRTLHYVSMDRPLSEILRETPPETERLVLCGPYLPAPRTRAWLTEPGTVKVGLCRKHGIIHATAQDHHRRIRISSMAEWLPDATLAPTAARALLAELSDKIRGTFHLSGPFPQITPAAMGRHLWLKCGGALYDPLPADLQAEIRRYSTPNRREVLALPTLQQVPAVTCWDLRFAFGALCEHLPISPATRSVGGELLPSTVGRVRVRYRVPWSWKHVGLLMEQCAGGWQVPAEPGYQGETWCDAAEARLARAAGWEITLLETIALREGLPCDTWARRIVRLYEAEPAGPLRSMLRRVLICTVGSWQGYGLTREEVIPTGDTIGPAVFETPADPLAPEKALFSHPEWCAAVWSRVRYRMAKAMLCLPRAQILGIYGDNLWTTGETPFRDRGQIGDLRAKGSVAGPVRAPRSEAELHSLSRRAQSHG